LPPLPPLDPAKVRRETEALLERAAEKYGDVKYPTGGTVGAQANNVLFSIRDLAVGKQAPDIEGDDQDGQHFKLRDYRGKVVLRGSSSPWANINWSWTARRARCSRAG
jgi:hypothetical protein